MVAYCILNQEKPEQVTLGCILHQATGNHCRCCTDYQAGKTKPAYPVPANIGRVSLGQDYAGLWFIDCADADNPEFVWAYDTWDRHNV